MTPTPHRYSVLASNLLFAAFFLPLALDLVTMQGFFNPNKPEANYLGVYAIMLVSLGLYYCIRRDWRWAKIVFLLLYPLSVLAMAWHFKEMLPGIAASPVTMVSFVLQRLLQVAALVLIVLSFLKQKSAQTELVSES